jgi:ankyrin repeat protein
LLNNTAASGDIDLFDHLVSHGADTSLCTALHAASRCTDGETSTAMVRHLLDKHNMDIDRNNEDLRDLYHDSQDSGSPLCSAIIHKNLPVVHELLARGAKVNDDPACSLVCYYAARPGGFIPALEPLLHAGADATEVLQQDVVVTMNIDAAKTCLTFGADPAPALRKAIEQEEYRAKRFAEDAAYDESKGYNKSERWIESDRAEERESQAMVRLLKSAVK